jgi:ribosomal protein S18 acetylase RimI-like enzyme
MTGEVRIRTALLADREAAVGLIQALNVHEAALTDDRLVSRKAAEAYYATLTERIARHDGRLLLAEADGRVVGMLGLVVQDDQVFVREEVRQHGHVCDLVVDEAWRGRGIGRRLLAEAERCVRAKGLKRLFIGVLAGNDGAERLYREVGFAAYLTTMMKPL